MFKILIAKTCEGSSWYGPVHVEHHSLIRHIHDQVVFHERDRDKLIQLAEAHNWDLEFIDIDYGATQNNKGA